VGGYSVGIWTAGDKSTMIVRFASLIADEAWGAGSVDHGYRFIRINAPCETGMGAATFKCEKKMSGNLPSRYSRPSPQAFGISPNDFGTTTPPQSG